MTRVISRALLAACFAVIISAVPASAQQKADAGRRPTIFAVLNDGKTLEPIAHLEGTKPVPTVSGADEATEIAKFNAVYYPEGLSYRLIFGGNNAGTVKVEGSNPDSDCGKNLAEAAVTSTRATLKGMVMGLATNAPLKKPGSGVRRLPTWPERNEIDALIRAEYEKNHVKVDKLDYHNLTALDVDGDKKAELVGSFWVENEPTARTLMFFIAEKGKDGKYAFGHTEFRAISQDEVMSGEIKHLDEGVYHELLLDVFDIDGDGVSEIFTYIRSFEGSGFHIYKRGGAGAWSRVYEASNYHCGY